MLGYYVIRLRSVNNVDCRYTGSVQDGTSSCGAYPASEIRPS